MLRSWSLLLLILGSFSSVHSLECYVCEGCETVSDADSKTCGETSSSTTTTTVTPSTGSSTASPGSSTDSSTTSSTQSSSASTTISTTSSTTSTTTSTTQSTPTNEFIATKETYDTKCGKATLEETEGNNVTVVRFCFPPADDTLLKYVNVIKTLEICSTDNCNFATLTQSTPFMIGMTVLLLFKTVM